MACYYCDRSPCVCTPSMFDDVPRPLPSEMAIRADERARVVAFIRARGRKLGGPAIVSEDIADAIERGDWKPSTSGGG